MREFSYSAAVGRSSDDMAVEFNMTNNSINILMLIQNTQNSAGTLREKQYFDPQNCIKLG